MATTPKKLLFVFNPQSGKGEIRESLFPIINRFTAEGFEVVVHPTQKRQDAFDVVSQRACQFDWVVCSGGDGTLNETVSGLMQWEIGKRPVLGYIPAGTTNDFATSLRIPKDPLLAVDMMLRAKPVLVDVGQFNNAYFCYVAAFGMFTDVPYDTSQELKNILGHAAYVLEGLKRLANVQSFRCLLQQDDFVEEEEYILGIVGNTVSIGGFQGIMSDQVALDDGEFEGIFVRKPQKLSELNDIALSLVLREKLSDCIRYFRTSRLEIDLKEKINWTLDGEYGGSPSRVIITNHQKALAILAEPLHVQTPPQELPTL